MMWFQSCILSVFQTVFAAPFVMTVVTLSTTLLSFLSRYVVAEVKVLCLCDDGRRQSRFHRPPKSKWNSASRRIAVCNSQSGDTASDTRHSEFLELPLACVQTRVSQLSSQLEDVRLEEASLRAKADSKLEEANRLGKELSIMAAELSKNKDFNFSGPL